jgi:hypothetical protein
MDTGSAVTEAIAELEREFGELQAEAAGDGGAYVTIDGLDIGPRWEPAVIDVSFLIPFNFPFNYVYPFYTNAVLSRADGNPLPSALQRVVWREREVTQISLRPNRWQPQHETASSLVYLVQLWFRELA